MLGEPGLIMHLSGPWTTLSGRVVDGSSSILIEK